MINSMDNQSAIIESTAAKPVNVLVTKPCPRYDTDSTGTDVKNALDYMILSLERSNIYTEESDSVVVDVW